MSRLAIILCLIPRVISGIYTTVRHETYSEHISRQSRSNLPTLRDGYVYRQFDKPGVHSAVGQPTVDPYVVNNQFEPKSFRKVRHDSPIGYEHLTLPYATPSTLKSEVDYAIAKSAADARYESSKSSSDTMLDKLKSLMHYRPPQDMDSDRNVVGYDGISDYRSMDDDDVRSSSRNYDNWPYFYHSPYEYEHNKDIFDTQKAKDKRYVADGFDHIIPVNEVIEDDHPQGYDRRAKHLREGSDNPITGDEPFFSFVLNDYYEKSGDDDPVIFKGLDFVNDFDHDTSLPEPDDNRISRRLGNNYYSTIRPATVHHAAYKNLAELESSTIKNSKGDRTFDKHENGAKKNAELKTGFENHANRYNGFKDFLDNFSNKFGSEDLTKNINYIRSMNQDKGENNKGFRRVYHKDEYQEDKEFYNNNNSSAKGLEKGGFNAHLGGSEAYLRSQAAAALGNESQAASNAGSTSDAKFDNSHRGHDRYNMLDNKLHKYRNVAKAAAQSNNADYVDSDYKDHYHK
ncbi:hypothetical protein PYW07_009166 [Mythimna separata]|uniref:Uncharacterized protein n=1 Tax=Mythimna separata TaxID=271217 RepID=A0AAD7YBP0_MYTSE|nr:hypothetical protein PYW07_009166 [Mythimna separata]